MAGAADIERFGKRFFLSVIGALRPVRPLPPASLPLKMFRRILVVKQHDQLGDLLVTTPAIRALRKRYPEAFIAVVVREYTAPLMWENPNVDDIIVFREKVKRWDLGWVRQFLGQLRDGGGFDCAVVLNSVSRSMSSDVIALLSRAKYIVGPNHLSLMPGEPERIYNSVTPRVKGVQSEIQHYLDIVRAIGAAPDGMEYDYVVTDEEAAEAEKMLYDAGARSAEALVGVHLGALNREKRLPLDTLAHVIARIKKEFTCEVAVFHGPHDASLCDQLLTKVDRRSVRVLPLMPLRTAAAVIRKMNLLLCNDTGTMHIASAVRTPTVSFHSISEPAQWKPPHERHIGLRAADRRIGSIKPDEVMAAVREQMGRIGLSPRPESTI
ncbi:MAG: glycosyltransferase family 9 protein [Bacteroidetes bacterium]|nr:MAG: glycosyltransferase family 9 protein [Bacteroidota bacterium]